MKKSITILILTLLLQVNSNAQNNLNQFSPGAKSIAMGRTGVIQIEDPTALYWNPALLGAIKRRSAVVAVNEPNHLTYTGYSHFIPMTGTFAASVAHTQKDVNGIELYSLGWGKQISRYMYFGAAVNNAISATENWVTTGIGFYIHSDATQNSIYRTLPPLAFLNSPFFRNRFAMGFSMQNIPLTESDHEHQTRIGASYKLTNDGFTVLFGYQMQSSANTSHLSIILPIQQNIKFIAGIMDYQFNKTAFGSEIDMGGFDLQLVYDYDVKRILFSTSIHIGQSLNELSGAEQQRAKTAVEGQMPDIALYHTKRALEYDDQNPESQKFYSILDPLVKQNKIKAEKTLNTAQQLEENEWYISAAMHYMQVLKLDPDNREAAQALERIRPKVNINTEHRFELGVATLEKNDLQKAKEIFESILYVRPDHEQSKYYLQKTNELLHKEAENHFFTGLGYYSQRNYDRAESEFNTALSLDPSYTEARDYINRIQRDRENNQKHIAELIAEANQLEFRNSWLQARDRYQEILGIDPDQVLARERLEQVNKKLDAVVSQNLNKGIQLYNQGDQVGAEKIFKQILKLDSQNATARQYINKINATTSSVTSSFMERARTHVENEDWTRALAVVDSVLGQYPNHSEATDLKSQILEHLNVNQMLLNARREYQNENYTQGMEICNQILVKEPNNIQALKILEQCQKQLNDQVDNYFNKGLEMYTKENYRTAILMWEKALEINPYHSGSLEYLKRARERLEAIEQLQK